MSTKNETWTAIQKAAQSEQAPTVEQKVAKSLTPEQYNQYLSAAPDAPSAEMTKTAPDAFDRIEALAKVVSDQTGCSPEVAAATLLEQNPALYDDYIAKRQQASEPAAEPVRSMAGIRSSRAEIRAHVREDVLKRLRVVGFDV